MLIGIGIVTGLTTVLFGFGGGFVTVPVIVWADGGLGPASAHVAVATSSLVMVAGAGIATAATSQETLRHLRGSTVLLALLALGGAVGTVAAWDAPGLVVQWGFVAYLIATIADLLLRPGFFRPRTEAPRRAEGTPVPVALGLPIGAVAAFLGVGGSVMTVPLLRRSGKDMATSASLANPLTLAIALPALAVFLTQGTGAGSAAGVFLIGPVDLGAAVALLAGALPVIVTLRRRRPRIPDRLYAWSYLGLLVLVVTVMIAASLR